MKDQKRSFDDAGPSDGIGNTKEVWCVCRSSETNRFMIGCDCCEEWFHGDCVGVTVRKADMIKNYYCDKCRKKNPKLNIIYKTSEVQMRKKRAGSISNSDGGQPIKKKPRPEKSSLSSSRGSAKFGLDVRDMSDMSDVSYMDSDEEEFDDVGVREEEAELRHASRQNLREELGKTSVRLESRSASDEIFDSRPLNRTIVESVGFTEAQSQPASVFGPDADMDDEDDFEPPFVGAVARSVSRPAATLVTSTSIPRSPSSSPPAPPPPPANRTPAPAPQTSQKAHGKSGGGKKKPSSGSKSTGGVGKRRDSRTKETAGSSTRGKKKRHRPSRVRNARLATLRSESDTSSGSEGESMNESLGGVQCYGPACVRSALRGSKYCSNDCGLRLAYRRLYEILPPRIQQWNSAPCAANEKNKRQLERIRADLQKCREKCVQMEREAQALERLQERIRAIKVDKSCEATESDEEQVEQIICVTCGNEVSLRSALRHMEKCFAKIESQSSFGTVYKSKDGANLFCDAYNKQAGTYCKRLKIICPEHSKDMKFPSDAICGFPLMKDVYHETDTFCRAPKRRCTKHFLHWERIRKARIDVEVVRQLMKMEDLMNEEREIRAAMTNRSGVLGLMLHQTHSHDMDPNPNAATYRSGGPPV